MKSDLTNNIYSNENINIYADAKAGSLSGVLASFGNSKEVVDSTLDYLRELGMTDKFLSEIAGLPKEEVRKRINDLIDEL